ncbi:MAG: hypothetical protein PVG51_12410 [Desulfosarcina sp.]
MMAFNQVAKQAFDFQKAAFTSWFDAAALFQDQAASTMETMMNKGNLVPEEGRKAMQSWANAYQEERDRFKSYVEAGFASLEKHFIKQSKSKPAKTTAKTAAKTTAKN